MLMENDQFAPHPDNSQGRAPPQNIEAEQALLGAILVNNEAANRVADFLLPAHFFDPLHAQIFELAARLIEGGKPATPVTLKTFFEVAAPISDNLTVPQYLGRLAASATSIINAREYGRTVYDLAARRRLIDVGEDLVNSAYDATIEYPAEALVEEAEKALFEVIEKQAAGREMGFSRALMAAIETASQAYQRPGHMAGLSTGLTDLDAKLGGLAPGNLIILAGRPSMGKTALGLNIAWHVAQSGKVSVDGEILPASVHFFSLEMTGEELANRVLGAVTELGSEPIRRGQISEQDFRTIVEASDRIRDTRLRIDESGGLTIAQLAGRARRAKRRHGCDLIVIDYLQLLRGTSKENRTQDVTQITMGLKALAKELNVPIIALSQLNRDLEKRTDKRPQLSDLRESGSIEQDADVVMFVFREEYYVEREQPDESKTGPYMDWQTKMAAVSGKAEIIIGKQRHGHVGIVQVQFSADTTSFSNLARVPFGERQI